MIKHGFTLADTLVTLAVIGIVAAITIPALIQDNRKSDIVVRVQKAQYVLSSLAKQIMAESNCPGDLQCSGAFANSANGLTTNIANAFLPRMNVAKYCGHSTGCFAKEVYIGLRGKNVWDINSDCTAKAVLSDGSLICMYDYTGNCTESHGTNPLNKTCGFILVDVNGFKGPNQYGRDTFMFWLTKTGTFPAGGPYDTANPESECEPINNNSGKACTAKVLKEHAMNY